MLRRLTLRGILVLLLVLTGSSITPAMSARISHSVSVTYHRPERARATERPSAGLPAGARSDQRRTFCATTLTPPSRLAEHALFERPPPTPRD